MTRYGYGFITCAGKKERKTAARGGQTALFTDRAGAGAVYQRRPLPLIVFRKPLARRVVQKKPGGDDVDRKTPFAIE